MSDLSEKNKENIMQTVIRCINFTSKYVNNCELTDTKYSQDNSNIKIVQLYCADQISNHHCYGVIQYHIDNEKLLNDANMYFEYIQNIIQNQSWAGENIKIERSDGNIFDTCIYEKSCLRLYDNSLMIFVKFMENDIYKYKWIPLLDYTCSKTDMITKGILSLNPHLKEKPLILTIDKHPSWMDEYRDKWIKNFTEYLDKLEINYRFQIKQ